MSTNRPIEGLIAAGFTPMQDNGDLNLAQVAPMVDQLINEQINGFFVCGSTGEGILTSSSCSTPTASKAPG